nr:hypothetical protein [Tanacetum cinerariifolium]
MVSLWLWQEGKRVVAQEITDVADLFIVCLPVNFTGFGDGCVAGILAVKIDATLLSQGFGNKVKYAKASCAFAFELMKTQEETWQMELSSKSVDFKARVKNRVKRLKKILNRKVVGVIHVTRKKGENKPQDGAKGSSKQTTDKRSNWGWRRNKNRTKADGEETIRRVVVKRQITPATDSLHCRNAS